MPGPCHTRVRPHLPVSAQQGEARHSRIECGIHSLVIHLDIRKRHGSGEPHSERSIYARCQRIGNFCECIWEDRIVAGTNAGISAVSSVNGVA